MHLDRVAALAAGYDLPTLAELIGRPAWHAEAACRGRRHPFIVNPDATQQVERAREVGGRCPVRAECLAYALEADVVGVWGGTTERERRRMRPQAAQRGVPVQADRSPYCVELLGQAAASRPVLRGLGSAGTRTE